MTRRLLPAALLAALAMALLPSCVRRSLSSESVRTAVAETLRTALRTDTVRIASRDTLTLRDTLRVSEERRGDTVYVTRTRTVWRDRTHSADRSAAALRRDTVYLSRRDSTAEKSTETRTRPAFAEVPALALRRALIAGIAVLLIYAAVYALRRLKK